MMRQITLLLLLAVCLAGCGQKQAVREEKVVKKQADQEEEAVSAILKLGGKVERDETLPGRPIVEVDLSKTKVTDSDLKDLKELKDLQRLNLSGTHITDAGLKDLKQALPTTDISGP